MPKSPDKIPRDVDEQVFWFGPTPQQPYARDPIDVISRLIELHATKCKEVSYLEIGVDEGETFDKVGASIKHGVDPYGGSTSITHRMTSQLFFAMNNYFFRNLYNVIFIDGCHMCDIIIQEVQSAANSLNPGGHIVLHDTAPVKESAQLVLQEDYDSYIREVVSVPSKERLTFRENTQKNGWIGYNGDAWKVVAILRATTPWGIISIPEACCTIISPQPVEDLEHQKILLPLLQKGFAWEDYVKNFDAILNPIDYATFEKELYFNAP